MPPAKIPTIACLECGLPNRAGPKDPCCQGCRSAALEYRSQIHQEKCDRLIAEGKCTKCRQPNANGKRTCDACLQNIVNRGVGIRAEGKCRQCANPSEEGKAVCRTCGEKTAASTVELAAVYKRLVYSAYGGFRCACCEDEREETLTLDHIYNDGKEDREDMKKEARVTIHNWLVRNGFPPGIQVLCHSCNMLKFRTGELTLARLDGLSYLPCCAAVPSGGARYKQFALTSSRRRFPTATEKTLALIAGCIEGLKRRASDMPLEDLSRVEEIINKGLNTRTKRQWVKNEESQFGCSAVACDGNSSQG